MRRADWKARLTNYLTHVARAPYELGVNDCALFAAGAVEAQRGDDPAVDLRGAYDSKIGGLRLLKAAGYSDHFALAAATCERIAPSLAAPGDLARVKTPDGVEALGVVQGEVVYALREGGGLALLPRANISEAYRV